MSLIYYSQTNQTVTRVFSAGEDRVININVEFDNNNINIPIKFSTDRNGKLIAPKKLLLTALINMKKSYYFSKTFLKHGNGTVHVNNHMYAFCTNNGFFSL